MRQLRETIRDSKVTVAINSKIHLEGKEPNAVRYDDHAGIGVTKEKKEKFEQKTSCHARSSSSTSPLSSSASE